MTSFLSYAIKSSSILFKSKFFKENRYFRYKFSSLGPKNCWKNKLGIRLHETFKKYAKYIQNKAQMIQHPLHLRPPHVDRVKHCHYLKNVRVWSPNPWKYGPQKLLIWTLFIQCAFLCRFFFSPGMWFRSKRLD